MHHARYLAIAVFSFGMLTGCVSSKVHQELQDQYDLLSFENDELRQQNEGLSADLNELRSELDRCRASRTALIEDSLRMHTALQKLQDNYDELNKNYDFLLENNNTMLANNARENRALLDKMEKLQGELEDKEDKLLAEQTRLNELSSLLQAREARVNELEGIISRQDSIVQYVQQRVKEALLGFEGKGLTVEMKDGQVYVSMDNRLLFASASWTVEAEGRRALDQLASVLADNPDIKIAVEGHTDNDAYRGTGQVRDNWDLSVMRATSVVKILQGNASISPERITAAGRSEYVPIADNNATEGKAKNRRIEIILTPDLSELMELIGSMR